jgi:hypothetical protein
MKIMIKSLIASAAIGGVTGMANAIPTLYISTTGLAGSYTAVASSATGAISYIGTAGVWNLFITSGLITPALGSATAPAVSIGITGTTTGAGSLWVGLADSGFTDASGGIMANITGHVVSGASESYLFETFSDTSNIQPTTTLPVGGVLTTLSGTVPVSTTATGVLPAIDPNTLGEILELTAFGATSTSVNASFASVPDGGATALLLGVSIAGLALLKRNVMV